MLRIIRIDEKGYTYYVLNRANARVQIFSNSKDYKIFKTVLKEAKNRFNILIIFLRYNAIN